MSEPWGQQGTTGFASQPAANDALTAGALMRRAREAAGLHVAALAVSLKVPVRKLEALESDHWDELPDAVFVRALASSVCRTLKIDPQPVLDRLPHTTAPRLIRASDGINATFRSPSDGSSSTWRDQLSRPVFLAVFALLLGALVMILLPSIQQSDLVATILSSDQASSPASPAAPSAATAAQAAASSVPVVTFGQPLMADAPAAALSPTVAASGAGASMLAAAAPAPAAAVVAALAPVPVASAVSATSSRAGSADPAAAADAAATPASGIIVFHTKGPSWVEVTDAKGVVAVRRLLGAGEAAGASGALPLRVVIGRVDATEVQVRGKPFNLRAVSHDNVARFEVK